MSEQTEFTALGNRIRNFRGKQSREAFAASFLVKPSSLARWEAGQNPPELGFLIRLTSAFGVSLEWLITGKDEFAKNGELLADHQLSYIDDIDWAKAKNEKASDSRTLENSNTSKLHVKNNNLSPTSDEINLQQENNTLNRELREMMRETADILRENGDLRVAIERQKARIAELERELARVLKGEKPSPVAHAG